MDINAMAQSAHEHAVEKGFWEDLEGDSAVALVLSAKCALIHSEVSELVEAIRYKPSDGEDFKYKRSMVAEELADIVIRVGDLAAHVGIDLGAAVVDKMRLNKHRSHRHGKLI